MVRSCGFTLGVLQNFFPSFHHGRRTVSSQDFAVSTEEFPGPEIPREGDMTGFWYFLLGLALASALHASPITDPYVRNLTLIGVIHVEGVRTKGQSVAVLRDRNSGKTRILHKGDSLVDADLEVRELGPQQVTLARGQQIFVLRVEIAAEAPVALTSQVESTDVELTNDKNAVFTVELPTPAESSADVEPKLETPKDERRLIPDPDCVGEECPSVAE
jgi:hypothetical protein